MIAGGGLLAELGAGRVGHVDAEGARHLVGRHDFTTFRDTMCYGRLSTGTPAGEITAMSARSPSWVPLSMVMVRKEGSAPLPMTRAGHDNGPWKAQGRTGTR